MTCNISRHGNAQRSINAGLRCALIVSVLTVPHVCFAQARSGSDQASAADRERIPKTASKTAGDEAPLTDRERALLELIRDLQERVARLEAQSAGSSGGTVAGTQAQNAASEGQKAAILNLPPPKVSDLASAGNGVAPAIKPPATDPTPPADEASNTYKQTEEHQGFGTYTPNLGFKLADTKYGDLNISIYTYVRYLNQKGLDASYTDAFGNVKSVQQRQDFQIQKVQIKFLGWLFTEKFRYFLYAWTSNANQGQPAQVVLAGNVNYTFNKHFTLSGGIRSLPGTRSVEGNFPFWLGVDSRMIADEYFRPSYTSGIWATGAITDRLNYQVMLGNNMSTLGVSAARLDNGLNTFSSAIVWTPVGEFSQGFSGQGWGDFEDHDKPAIRLGAHFNRSDENKESQPNSDTFENTQLRLSDGTVIFTPDLFGPGITIEDARWRMMSFDAGLKYHGYSLEGEYYIRSLDHFRGENTAGLKSIFDQGFQLQGSAMVVPKTLQTYLGHSRIFGKYGDPWDLRMGLNWFPFKNHVVRWNTEGLYLYKSPVGYTSVPFAVGGRGWVFHSSFELAF